MSRRHRRNARHRNAAIRGRIDTAAAAAAAKAAARTTFAVARDDLHAAWEALEGAKAAQAAAKEEVLQKYEALARHLNRNPQDDDALVEVLQNLNLKSNSPRLGVLFNASAVEPRLPASAESLRALVGALAQANAKALAAAVGVLEAYATWRRAYDAYWPSREAADKAAA